MKSSMFTIFSLMIVVVLLVSCPPEPENNDPDNTEPAQTNVGEIDTDFGTNGTFTHDNAASAAAPETDIGRGIILDDLGNVYVAGESQGEDGDDMAVWKLTPDGELDTGFNTVGFMTTSGGDSLDPSKNCSGEALILGSAGNIVIAGSGITYLNYEITVLWGVTATGELASSFSSNGVAMSPVTSKNNASYSVAVGADGYTYSAGFIYTDTTNFSDMIVYKYNSLGMSISAFGSFGLYSHHNAAGGYMNDLGYDIKYGTDGKLYIVGESDYGGGDSSMAVWRVTTDGELDTSFADDGCYVYAPDDPYDYSRAQGLVLGSDGSLYIVGWVRYSTDRDICVWKLDSDGEPVNSFGTDGVVTFDDPADTAGNTDDVGDAITIDNSDNIYVLAHTYVDSEENLVLYKLDSGGDPVSGFGDSGLVIKNNIAGGDGDDCPQDLVLDSEGGIYITGYSENSDGNFDMFVIKYK